MTKQSETTVLYCLIFIVQLALLIGLYLTYNRVKVQYQKTSEHNQSVIRDKSAEIDRLNAQLRKDDAPLTPKPVPSTLPRQKSTALVSWYGWESCTNPRCLTASGEVFDPNKDTAACLESYPLGTRFMVAYGSASVWVLCNDRFYGGYGADRFLDLSRLAFSKLAPLSRGVIRATVTKI